MGILREIRLATAIASIILVILLPGCLIGETTGAKILSISFMSSKSHKIVYEPLLLELAQRGHEVTIVSPIKSDKKMKNLRLIEAIDLDSLGKEANLLSNLFEKKIAGG